MCVSSMPVWLALTMTLPLFGNVFVASSSATPRISCFCFCLFCFYSCFAVCFCSSPAVNAAWLWRLQHSAAPFRHTRASPYHPTIHSFGRGWLPTLNTFLFLNTTSPPGPVTVHIGLFCSHRKLFVKMFIFMNFNQQLLTCKIRIWFALPFHVAVITLCLASFGFIRCLCFFLPFPSRAYKLWCSIWLVRVFWARAYSLRREENVYIYIYDSTSLLKYSYSFWLNTLN